MTDAAATEPEPVVRWDPRRQVLVGSDGDFTPTTAQEAKARRYLAGGLVKPQAVVDDGHGWGVPSRVTQVYLLDPIPGCRQQRRVTVVEFYDAAGTMTGITLRCDCQKAAGTVAVQPDACSHTLAVHLYRRAGGPQAA